MYRKPLQMLAAGKLQKVKLVTMPKLLEPPLKARQRSGLVDAQAAVVKPEARTSS